MQPVLHRARPTKPVDDGGQRQRALGIERDGGLLGASGVLIAAGALVPRLALTSTVVCTVVYSAYGLSRIISIAIDGTPAAPLIQAMIADLVIGAIGALMLRAALRQDTRLRAAGR